MILQSNVRTVQTHPKDKLEMDDLQPASTSSSLPEFQDVIGSLFVEVEDDNSKVEVEDEDENSKVETEVENSTVSLD